MTHPEDSNYYDPESESGEISYRQNEKRQAAYKSKRLGQPSRHRHAPQRTTLGKSGSHRRRVRKMQW